MPASRKRQLLPPLSTPSRCAKCSASALRRKWGSTRPSAAQDMPKLMRFRHCRIHRLLNGSLNRTLVHVQRAAAWSALRSLRHTARSDRFDAQLPGAPSSGSSGSPMRMQVSTKSPHHGFFDGSPNERLSRFSQSISQERSRVSWRPRADLASVIQGKGPGGVTYAAQAVRWCQRPSMAPGKWPNLSRPLWMRRMGSWVSVGIGRLLSPVAGH